MSRAVSIPTARPTTQRRSTSWVASSAIESFLRPQPATEPLVNWLQAFGHLERVGVEGTGTYGAGLTRQLRAAGVTVVEVDHPDRKARRGQGKSDPLDAYSAARAALARKATGVRKPKTAVSRQSACCV